MNSYRDLLLSTASAALRGEVEDINIRRDGRVALLNASKELMWTGYSPRAELLKGLIVRTDKSGNKAVDLIAGCLAKFYNWNENAENDRRFLNALTTPGAELIFTEKLDGTNIRPWLHPDSGNVEFATRGMLRSKPVETNDLDFSAMARAIASERYPALLDPQIVGTYTIICELIHPANRILTDYGDRRDLVVIAVVELATGRELRREALLAFCRSLKLTAVKQYHVAGNSFIDAITRLRSDFAGTDLEGAVAAIEHPQFVVPYRLKIKNETYLRMLRLAQRCTMKTTRELIEGQGLTSWDAFLTALRRATPDLPEEIVLGYRRHFERWTAWEADNQREVSELVEAYVALPQRNSDDQKAFALSIADDPRRNAFFLLRRYGLKEGARRLLLNVRRAREHMIRDAEIDEKLAE